MTFCRRLTVRLAACLLLLVAAEAAAQPPDKVSLRTIEGEIVSIGAVRGEGDLDLIVAEVRAGAAGDENVQVLLAPEAVCDEIGFRAAPGDRLRVRIFADDEGPARAQKAMNLSQGTMVRLRTLHRIPLWNTHGVWQGGPIRGTTGPHRHGAGARQGHGR